MHQFVKLKHLFLFVLVSTFLVTQEPEIFRNQVCDTPIHEDYAPLMALYNATNGDNWLNHSGWGETCDVCVGWKGISCVNGRVNKVLLFNNNLTGYLPPEFFNLPTATEISLIGNKIGGNIPNNIINCQNLKSFGLALNDFTGNIPSTIGGLKNLEYLYLGFNALDGAIPLEIGDLSAVKTLNLGSNNLIGEIPISLRNLANLEILILSRNNLTGNIPIEITELSSLKSLDLYGNKLTGSIPTSIGNLSNLELLWLFDNQLSGGIPSSIVQLSNLKKIRLNNNLLSNELPANFESLSNLEEVFLDHNQLSGPLPSNIGNLSLLKDLRLHNNSFESNLPQSLGKLQNLKYLYLNENNFEGVIPSDIGDLTSILDIRLSGNNLDGEIPIELSHLSTLTTLLLAKNNLSGGFPEFIANMSNLSKIDLSFNKLTGCFPDVYHAFCTNLNNVNFFQNCTFENPSFEEFCAGVTCNDDLNLNNLNNLSVCEGQPITILAPSNYQAYQWSSSNSIGRSVTFAPNNNGYHYITVTNDKGCLKIDSFFITVLPIKKEYINVEICESSSFTINGTTYNEPGEYQQTISNQGSCDSILFISLEHISVSESTMAEMVCAGETIEINSISYGQGNYIQILTNSAGCDSTLYIEVSEYGEISTNLDFVVCPGNTIKVNNEEFGVGNAIQLLRAQNGCDSILYINVVENPLSEYEVQEYLCTGTAIQINGILYDQPGIYVQNLENSFGCDSILTIHVNEIFESYSDFEAILCEGNTIEINQIIYDSRGNYEQHLTNRKGCDSVVFISIIGLEATSENLFYHICPGENIVVNNYTYDSPNTYVQTLENALGCDSSLFINLEYYELKDTFIEAFVCENSTYNIVGLEFKTSGHYQINTFSQNGCDSLINLSLTIITGSDTTIQKTICQGEKYLFAGNRLYQSGTYQDSLIIDGCKAMVTLELKVVTPSYGSFYETICEGDDAYFQGEYYSKSGSYSVTIPSSNGCDSFVTMNLSVLPNYEIYIDTFICNGGTIYYDFFNYTSPGTYQINKQSTAGCDSLILLNINEYEELNNKFEFVICKGSTLEFYGQEYSAGNYEGIYSDGFCNQNFELIITTEERILISKTFEICGNSFFEFMDEEYINSGQYLIHKETANCEFIEYINVVRYDSNKPNETLVLCEGTTLNLSGIEITENGTYSIDGENENCDGAYLISVLFVNGTFSTFKKTIGKDEIFHFNGKSFSSEGTYYENVGIDGGCTSMVELIIEVENCGGERTLELNLCKGEIYHFYDQIITSSGTYAYSKSIYDGCDSLINLNISFNEEINFEINGSTRKCIGENVNLAGPDGYSYIWSTGAQSQAINVQKEGIYNLTISDENFCSASASIEISNIILPSFPIIITASNPTICGGQNGSIVINVDNPELFNYSIDGGTTWSSNNHVTNLKAGNYQILIADPDLICVLEEEINVSLKNPNIPIVNEILVTQLNTCTNGMGNIEIIPFMENEDLLYSIDGGTNWQSNNYFENLTEGVYQVQLKNEGSGCINYLESEITIEDIGFLEVNINILEEPNCSDSNDGKASIHIIHGQSPFQYFWPNGEQTQSASNLSAGSFMVTVVDANNCIQEIPFNLSGIDVDQLIAEFMDTTICINDTLNFTNLDTSYKYTILREGILYYNGNRPKIFEVGNYEVVIDLASGCFAKKNFKVENIDLQNQGIDFLLSTVGVKNQEVALVNISDPMPDSYLWKYDQTKIKTSNLNELTQYLRFTEVGEYVITFETSMDGCIASFDKTITIYEDSTYLEEKFKSETNISNLELFKIFPNPNDGKFNVEIEFNIQNSIELIIYNSSGSLIEFRELSGSNKYHEAFNLSNANSGIYAVFLKYQHKIIQQNILILK